MTTYVCPACHSVHEFMSLAVICAETHTIGARRGSDGESGCERAPVLTERRAG